MPRLKQNPTLKDFQEYISQVVKERGFDKETEKDKLTLFVEEVGELARAIRINTGIKVDKSQYQPEVAEELVDCLHYVCDLANKYGIDLEKAFREKEEKNKQRKWE